jgi:hypothetical protein
VHHLADLSVRQATGLDRMAIVSQVLGLTFSLPPANVVGWQLRKVVSTQPKGGVMARLLSIAAVAASVLSAAFLAGLTCGG